jgi:hypothetical protein
MEFKLPAASTTERPNCVAPSIRFDGSTATNEPSSARFPAGLAADHGTAFTVEFTSKGKWQRRMAQEF